MTVVVSVLAVVLFLAAVALLVHDETAARSAGH
jgi:hypothetical protein